jgi:hypothetical protein
MVLSAVVKQINRGNLCKNKLNVGNAACVPVYNNKSVCLICSLSVVVTRNGKRTKFYQPSGLLSKQTYQS